MIPTEVEIRLAWYLYQRHLPDKVKIAIEYTLLPSCIWLDNGEIDHDELVRSAIELIDKHFEDKTF